MFFRRFFLVLITSSNLFATSNTVLFDFGGVMTKHSELSSVLTSVNESFEHIPNKFEKTNLEAQYAFIQQGDNASWDMAKYNIFSHKIWDQESKTILKTIVMVNDEMYSLVEELKSKKVPVALLSNSDKQYSAILKKLDLYSPFEPCFLSCNIGAEKPDPGVYKIVLDNLNIPANQIVFFDDREENIEAAKQAGFDAILFESAMQAREELAKRNLLCEKKSL